MKRVRGFMSLLTLLCAALSLLSTAAMAQQGGGGGGTGGSGGGSGGGNGGGSGGGSNVVIITASIAMNNAALSFNGTLPQGTVTFTYTKSGVPQNLDVRVSSINVPDGTVVTIQAVDALRVTGRCWHYEYYYYPMTIKGGKGSLSFSASKGDFVPFLDPKKGFTEINASPNYATSASILTSLLPFKGIL